MVGLHRSAARSGTTAGDQFFGSADRHFRELDGAMRKSSQPHCAAAIPERDRRRRDEAVGWTLESGLREISRIRLSLGENLAKALGWHEVKQELHEQRARQAGNGPARMPN